MMLKNYLVVLLCLMVVCPILAQETPPPTPVVGTGANTPVPKLKLLLGAGAEFGGDKIAEVFFTNGEDQSVNAGQGGYIFVGGQLQLTQKEFLFLRSSIGVKYVTTQANNANIGLIRFPFNHTLNAFIGKNFRLGAGAAIHTGVKFNGDGFIEDINFGTSVGPTFEFAFKGIGISYTIMSYKDENNFEYNANSFGINFSGVLSGKKKK